jgi:hypothetical protein
VERVEKVQALRSGLALTTRVAHAESKIQAVREGIGAVRNALAGHPDAAALGAEADALEEGLARAGDTRAVGRLRRSVATLAGSYDRPTEGQRVDLRRMEEAVVRLVADLNAFLGGDVAAFRARVERAGLSVFPDPGLVPDPGEG